MPFGLIELGMYGIVNKAIEELVKENFGEEKWEEILKKSGIEVDFFISNEAYDDSITFKLAIAVGEVLEIPLDAVLEEFGKFWVLRTAKEKYGGLMEAGGRSLAEFLSNLPAFHTRVMLIYPKLQPPEFRVEQLQADLFHVFYYSKRDGLQGFVRGLLLGLGEMFDSSVEVKLLRGKHDGLDHDQFSVCILN